MQWLPPLNALKAFYAASRNQSFSGAAKEIHVTQGAISRHIRQLEDILGTQLFRRLPRGVELTDEGKVLAFAVGKAFDDIANAVDSFRTKPGATVISISTVPSIAARWLVPRLEKFQRQHHDIEMRISTTHHLVDLERDGFDLVIRYGRGDWPGLEKRLLFSQRMATVCAPSIIEDNKRPLIYQDLAEYRLIVSTGFRYWKAWFKAVGVEEIKPKAILDIDDTNVAIQAALEAQGIALLPEVLVRSELRAGRLVQAFPETLKDELGYFLAYASGRRLKPHVQAVFEWLLKEARADGPKMDPALLP